MINKLLITILLIVVCPSMGIAEQLYYVAPTQLPNVTREMQSPAFWISRIPDPDKEIMSSSQVKAFNKHVREELGLVKDLMAYPTTQDGKELRHVFLGQAKHFEEKNYFRLDDRQTTSEFFRRLREVMAIEQVPDQIKVRYGIVVSYAHQRLLPTEERLLADKGDIDFDEVQNSALDLGTPVIILHQSSDKKWFYVVEALTDGWVRADSLGICSRADFEKFLNPTLSVRAHAQTHVFFSYKRKFFYDSIRMGSPLPSLDSHMSRVLLPTRTPDGSLRIFHGYMNGMEPNHYLTTRNLFYFAFEMLNEPYGWGGMYGEQDCSRFLQQIFSISGITLPRNSGDQAKVGQRLFTFDDNTTNQEKIEALKTVTPGAIILWMPGHIMLYLGIVNDRPYAIHAFWGYREPTPEGDRVRVVNRVAVSDLYLGEGSKKGSLLKRLRGIIQVKHHDKILSEMGDDADD